MPSHITTYAIRKENKVYSNISITYTNAYIYIYRYITIGQGHVRTRLNYCSPSKAIPRNATITCITKTTIIVHVTLL